MKKMLTALTIILFVPLITMKSDANRLKNQQPSQEVTGVVTSRGKSVLPKDAVISVRILDATTPKGPNSVIAQRTARIPHQLPIPFDLIVKGGSFNARHNYVLQAVITRKGRQIWRNAEVNPVLTNGSATEFVVLMTPVASRSGK